ncbi:MAG: hypothetical protein WA052_02505 [Microgenomates group bacterium]
MKYFSLLLTTCLVFFLFPKSAHSAITLNISNLEKGESNFSLDATLSGISSSSSCYVQVVITAPGSPHYFGQTWSPKGEWFKYISSPAKEYIVENFIKLENDQTTKIIFNTDPDDEDYKGPGEYLVKLNRYTGGSTSSAGDSNSLTMNIADPTPTSDPTTIITETPTNTPTSTTTPTNTPTNTSTPTPVRTPTKTPTPTPTPTTKLKTTTPTKTPVIAIKTTPSNLLSTPSTILGESTDSASLSADMVVNIEITPTPENIINKPKNYKTPFFIGLFLAVSSSALLYFRHRKD